MNTTQKIIDRIEKLMAMANDSSSPNEASIALTRAQKLMSKHGISDSDLALSTVKKQKTDKVSKNSSKLPMYLLMLIDCIENAFECKAIIQPRLDGTSITFYGIGTDPLIAKYTMEILSRQLKKARADYIANMVQRDEYGQALLWTNFDQKYKTIAGDSFAVAWVNAASRKAGALRSRISPEKETILRKYEKATWPTLGIAKSTGGLEVDIDASIAGQSAAKNIYLNHGMGGAEQAKIGVAL